MPFYRGNCYTSMGKKATFTKDVVELSRGQYRTLGISIPAGDVQELKLKKGDRILATIEKV